MYLHNTSYLVVIYYLDLETIEKIRQRINLEPFETGYQYKGGVEFVLDFVKDIGEDLPERDAIVSKAGFLLYNISGNQYFVCGNKRTGLLIASTFLNINNLYLNASEADKYLISRAIASRSYSVEKVIGWIGQNLIQE